MSNQFQHIVLMARDPKDAIIETVDNIYEFLKNQGVGVVMETQTAQALHFDKVPTVPVDELGEACDLAIVVGGDGSLLHAARAVVAQHVPVLGINRGRLGFLTDICPDELGKILQVIEGQCTMEKRFLLYTEVQHEDKTVAHDNALNDVVLLPEENVGHILEFEIYIDDQLMCSQRSDGLIVATPTGSTAYALSGGGPILHPELDAIVLVPMFPHSLTYRPIVVSGNSEIKIVVNYDEHTRPGISCDGQPSFSIEENAVIRIMKNRNYLQLIHPLGYDYFESLRSKLYWSKAL